MITYKIRVAEAAAQGAGWKWSDAGTVSVSDDDIVSGTGVGVQMIESGVYSPDEDRQLTKADGIDFVAALVAYGRGMMTVFELVE
jgi:hypothetical protein